MKDMVNELNDSLYPSVISSLHIRVVPDSNSEINDSDNYYNNHTVVITDDDNLTRVLPLVWTYGLKLTSRIRKGFYRGGLLRFYPIHAVPNTDLRMHVTLKQDIPGHTVIMDDDFGNSLVWWSEWIKRLNMISYYEGFVVLEKAEEL